MIIVPDHHRHDREHRVPAVVRRALLLGLAWALVAAGAAAAAPSPQLVHAGARLFGRYCATCHGGGGRGIEPGEQNSGGGPGRSQEQQQGAGPDLFGVGALAADFYLRTGYMPLPELGVQPKRRSRLLLTDGQINALTAYVASLGHGPAIPTPAPGAREPLERACSSSPSTAPAATRSPRAGGYVTGGVAPPLDRRDAAPDRRGRSRRAVPDAACSRRRRSATRELDSIVRYVEYAKHPDDRGGWALGHVGPVPEGLVTWFVGIVVDPRRSRSRSGRGCAHEPDQGRDRRRARAPRPGAAAPPGAPPPAAGRRRRARRSRAPSCSRSRCSGSPASARPGSSPSTRSTGSPTRRSSSGSRSASRSSSSRSRSSS